MLHVYTVKRAQSKKGGGWLERKLGSRKRENVNLLLEYTAHEDIGRQI
jgi:hypothetical protein